MKTNKISFDKSWKMVYCLLTLLAGSGLLLMIDGLAGRTRRPMPEFISSPIIYIIWNNFTHLLGNYGKLSRKNSHFLMMVVTFLYILTNFLGSLRYP